MVFYVVNKAGAPVHVTIDKMWSPDKPDAWKLTVSSRPLASGVHAASFTLKNDKAHQVEAIREQPKPLHVALLISVLYDCVYDRNGDLVFVIKSFMS
jgi:hypothetical protein